LQIVKEAAPSVIVLAEELPDVGTAEVRMTLDTGVNALALYAPVVVIGRTEQEPRLRALIAAGVADFVPRAAGCVAVATGLMERRLLRVQHIAEGIPSVTEEWPRDFAEVLRHELNNPLTGILGNAELLLAEITRKNDGRLPHGGRERVETIAALAMKMRETVRQLSNEWEIRSDGVRSA
jgi:signal transduction histidine kinase